MPVLGVRAMAGAVAQSTKAEAQYFDYAVLDVEEEAAREAREAAGGGLVMDLTDRLVIGTSDSTNEPTVEKGLGYALFFIGDHDDDDSSEMNNDMAQDSEACESREASPVKVTPADADGDCSEASLALRLNFSKADQAGSAALCGARSSESAGPGCCSLSIRRATWGGQRRRAHAQVAKCSDAQETKEVKGVTEKENEDTLECDSSHGAEGHTHSARRQE